VGGLGLVIVVFRGYSACSVVLAGVEVTWTRALGESRTQDLIIPVTHRVKRYTRFVGKYVTGRSKSFRIKYICS